METVLAVFAHPDDETFICGGTLAKYAAQGKRVALVCATKGEMGRRLGVPPTATRETLAALRERELQAACDALGVAQLVFLGLRDKTLEIQPFDDLVEAIAQIMDKELPRRVITFHEQYGGHPDHRTIGRAATRAFLSYKARNPASELRFVAWAPIARDPGAYGLRAGDVEDVNVADFLDAKLAAFRAHETQSRMNAWLWESDERGREGLGKIEYFIRFDPSADGT